MYSIIGMTSSFIGALLMTVTMASAQTPRHGETLSIQGYPGEVSVTRWQGRALIDVQDLAQITNGSVRFEKNRIILTLPQSDASEPAADHAAKSGFSRAFMRASIEAMASIREWGGMLMVTVQDGYPVGNTMAGNTVIAYEERASESVSLASAAASTESDSRGLELLRNEFSNLQAWADGYVKARNSLSAANLTISEGALDNDEGAQKIIACGQFLARMFAGGAFQDDAACH
jgi:hypothetical protein